MFTCPRFTDAETQDALNDFVRVQISLSLDEKERDEGRPLDAYDATWHIRSWLRYVVVIEYTYCARGESCGVTRFDRIHIRSKRRSHSPAKSAQVGNSVAGVHYITDKSGFADTTPYLNANMRHVYAHGLRRARDSDGPTAAYAFVQACHAYAATGDYQNRVDAADGTDNGQG